MVINRRSVIKFLAFLTAWAGLASGVAAQDMGGKVTVLDGARLIDGTGRPAIEDGVVVIQGNHVVAAGMRESVKIPKSANVISVKGKTIIPGIINAHGHLGLVVGTANSADGYTRENVVRELNQYERFGVTSMLSLGLNRDLVFDLRAEQVSGDLGGATIFTAGRGIGVPGGLPPIPVAPDQLLRPATAKEARNDLWTMSTRRVDIVKIWVDDSYGRYPKMQPAIYQAVIDESHKLGLRVAAHVFYLDDAKALVAAGVNVLAHSIRDQPVDNELIQVMKQRGVIYIPTLDVEDASFAFADHPEIMEDPFFQAAAGPDLLKMLQSDEYRQKTASDPLLEKYKAAAAMGVKNLKTLNDAGVKIALGTDSGAFPVRIPGWAEHRELELMVQAGLTPMQAVVAATRGSAAVAGTLDRGTIEAGKRADLLVLDGNPLEDIRNTRKISAIYHNGESVKPAVESAMKAAN